MLCAASFSWWGNSRSFPPQWMSKEFPKHRVAHCRAFNMPPRSSEAPRGFPFRKVLSDEGFHRTKSRLLLFHDSLGSEGFRGVPDNFPYSGQLSDIEENMSFRNIGMSLVQKDLYHFDHSWNVLGRLEAACSALLLSRYNMSS